MTAAFTYHRPATLAEAAELGRTLGGSAAYLAGGTELIPDYRRERETARHLIALDAIEELRGIGAEGRWLRIGALATIAEVASAPLVRSWLPALAEAAAAIGSPPIRSLATIGGNFCRAVPCADTPPVALVAGARVRLGGGGHQRELDAEQLFLGPRRTALEPGEVLLEIRIPRQPGRSGVSYHRFARRQGSSLAVAAVAARVALEDGTIREARIGLGAVAPIPCRAPRAEGLLAGHPPSADLFALAAASAAEEARPISDVRGSEAFRRELVHVLSRRALEEATARALGRAP
jgi:carbon-monoxide dehydrogenase medium subunit